MRPHDYRRSPYCRREMDRAVALDPDFRKGTVIPVCVDDCKLPQKIAKPEPICVNLRDDRAPQPWDLLMQACGADLGTDVPSWLAARDGIRRFLQRNQSVNLVVQGDGVKWRPLIGGLTRGYDSTTTVDGLTIVDLADPETISCRGLVTQIIRSLSPHTSTPKEGEQLAELRRFVVARGVSRVALTHFDLAAHRAEYDVNLFAALRYLSMEIRMLVVLIQSRTPLASLLPRDHPLSGIDFHTVELRARP